MYISYFVILNQILICSIITVPRALKHDMMPHHEICKHFSIFCSAVLKKTEIVDTYFFNFPRPRLTGFLTETKSVFERIL